MRQEEKENILSRFRHDYNHLVNKGMIIRTIADIMDGNYVINIELPFIFDNRKLPEEYMGCHIRTTITEPLPKEFCPEHKSKFGWNRTHFVWAPERFEKFVDRCTDEIREKLGNPNMSRDEMLDALKGEDFATYKERILMKIDKGIYPPYKEGCE